MYLKGIYPIPADNIPDLSISNKCVVLDLDQTLIATQESMSSLHNLGILTNPNLISLRSRIYHIIIKNSTNKSYEYWGIVRPHINDFLLFCFSYFKVVAVWSAGERNYVEEIVAHIFKDLPKPHIIYARENTQISNQSVLKSLDKLFNHNSIFKKYMNRNNTLAIDDNLTTFANNRGNGVAIPAFEPDLNIISLSKDDPTLLQLMYWLLQPHVINSTDVTKLDKSKIFTTPLNVYKNNYIVNPNFTFT